MNHRLCGALDTLCTMYIWSMACMYVGLENPTTYDSRPVACGRIICMQCAVISSRRIIMYQGCPVGVSVVSDSSMHGFWKEGCWLG